MESEPAFAGSFFVFRKLLARPVVQKKVTAGNYERSPPGFTGDLFFRCRLGVHAPKPARTCMTKCTPHANPGWNAARARFRFMAIPAWPHFKRRFPRRSGIGSTDRPRADRKSNAKGPRSAVLRGPFPICPFIGRVFAAALFDDPEFALIPRPGIGESGFPPADRRGKHRLEPFRHAEQFFVLLV